MDDYLEQLPKSKSDILVVDDRPENLRVVSEFLKDRGYRVRKALNGELALISCQKCLPDIILLDINMPDMDGYQVCQRLKLDEKTRHIPVIFISILDETSDKVKAFSIGGVDYITKPLNFEELVMRVENQLTIKRLQLSLQEKNQLLEAQNDILVQEIKRRQQAEENLQAANEKLQKLVSLDSLTGIANRRHFDEYLQREWLRSAREKIPLSLIMCDIDYFKFYNDTYGHLAGDDCLKQVARTISSTVKRPADLVARYGGEELAVILPNTNFYGAMGVARNIQFNLKQLKIVHRSSPIGDYITLSMGVYTSVAIYQDSPYFLIEGADKALYEAKRQGRDRYCAYLNNLSEINLHYTQNTDNYNSYDERYSLDT